jgi:poly(A) polymerase
MQPQRTKQLFDWMQAPALQKVVAAFSSLPNALYFVGGCVRDSLLGRPFGDIDLASPLTPDKVALYLQKAGIPFKEVGKTFGTLMAVVEGQSFEITSFRRDIETDGRWAKVSYTSNLLEDAARRDFTMNALYLTPSGDLYDPWGGIDDLRNGCLRFIGEPAARIQEDYLRILRFFRFYAWVGRVPPDAATLDACQKLATNLTRISGERIRAEFMKLLAAPDPSKSLDMMAATQLTDSFLGIPLHVSDFKRLQQVEAFLHVQASPLVRLSILLGSKLIDNLQRFAFSNKESSLLEKIAGYSHYAQQPIHEWLYRQESEIAQAFIFLKAMQEGLSATLHTDWQQISTWQRPHFPLTGHDAIKIGLQGAAIGQALQAVEDWWIGEHFQPTYTECLKQLQGYA